MPYLIQANRKYQSFTLHMSANSGSVVIAGNSAVSNVAIGDETLTGAYITQAFSGSPSGLGAYWQLKRGSNPVICLDSTGSYDWAGQGNPVTVFNTSDFSANLIYPSTYSGPQDGYLIIEFQKQGNFSQTPYFHN